MNGNVKAGAGDEWFDVVNERDEVVGRERRTVVHARGLWHRAVHILIFNQAGQVFLQKRSISKDTAPGCWDSSCSGHVDAGEDYDVAAVRELREELGINVSACPERIFREHARRETGWEFVEVYWLQHEGPFELHPDEIERGEWRTPAEVTSEIARVPADYAPAFRHLWSRITSAPGNNNPG